MALRYWRGTNTDTTDTANWAATRTGVTGQSVPGSSDTAYFYDGDLDVAANTAFAPLAIVIGGNFRGNMVGLLLATAACVVTIETVAPNKQISIGPAAAVTLAAIHVKQTVGTVNIVAGAAGVLTLLNVGKTGTIVIDGSCAVTTYNNAGMFDTVTYSATAITTAQWSGGGTHQLQRSVTTGTIDGATRVYTINSVAFTTATVSAGGILAHDSDGTLTTFNAKPGGTLQPVTTQFTVTNTNVWEGGNINRNSDKITFTNAPVPIGNAA